MVKAWQTHGVGRPQDVMPIGRSDLPALPGSTQIGRTVVVP